MLGRGKVETLGDGMLTGRNADPKNSWNVDRQWRH